MSFSSSRTVQFNKLPEAVRERFIACTNGQSAPVPVLSEQLGMGMATVGWGSLLLCAAGGFLALTFAGFGDVWSDVGLQSAAFIALYLTTAFLAVYSLLAIVRRKRLLASLPYTPGRYLFPMDYVDATSDELRIVSMATLLDFRGVHHHTNGAYTHTEFNFSFEGGSSESMTVRGKDQAERVLQTLRSSQAQVARAIDDKDIDGLYVLDLFLEARVSDNWEADEPKFFNQASGPQTKSISPLLSRAAVVALVASSALSPVVWMARNYASDEDMFAGLQTYGSESAVESYIHLGGRHADEAKRELLPRAGLREAKQRGTVTALRLVAHKYAEHEVAADARKEITKLFEQTRAEFRGQAAQDNPEMLALMDELITQLEKSDSPTVLVRFGKPSATALGKADEILNREFKDKGGVIPIAGHFDEGSSAPREKAIVGYLNSAFSAIFPADILQLEQGDRIAKAPPSQEQGSVDKPTIEILYDVSPSGDTYVEDNTNNRFVGIKVTFFVSMRVPDHAQSLSFMLEVEPPDHFSVGPSPLAAYGMGSYKGAGAGRVYHAMATNAFGQLASKLRKVYFRPGTDAYAGKGKHAKAKLPPLSYRSGL